MNGSKVETPYNVDVDKLKAFIAELSELSNLVDNDVVKTSYV